MKTKIFGGIAIVVIALAVAFNVSLNTSKTNNASLLALANVEALASESGSTSKYQFYNYDCSMWKMDYACRKTYSHHVCKMHCGEKV